MYYTTSGAYRTSKMIIDYANIALTVCVGVMFILILFFRSSSGIIFPLIFLAGCLVNALTSAKRFMEKNKVAGVILAITAVVLLVLSAMCFAAVLK